MKLHRRSRRNGSTSGAKSPDRTNKGTRRWRLAGASALAALCFVGATAPMALAAPVDQSSSTVSAAGQIGPVDILNAIKGGKAVYDFGVNCQKNLQSNPPLPCTTPDYGREFADLTNQINALSAQITAQTAQINTNGTALYLAVTQADVNGAWRNLGADNAKMQIVAAKEMDYEGCMAALDQTALNALPGGSGAASSCTMTTGNGLGHLEMDPATGQPKQFPMRTMTDMTGPDGPQSRLLNATLEAYVPAADRSNPAAVYSAFRDQGLQVQAALAGVGPSDGLLPEVFTHTLNSDYVQDSNHQKTPDGTPPAYLSGTAVDTVNQANTAMTGLEAQYFNGLITALRIVEQQSPPAGQAQDADWADTLTQQITDGAGTLTQQSLANQRNSWSIPVYGSDGTLSPANSAGSKAGFVITYPDAAHPSDLLAYQTSVTGKGSVADGHSNAAPTADPNIPTKALLDNTSDRLQAMGQPYSTIRTNHPDAAPTTMWADMGKTETLHLNDISSNPSDQWASGQPTTATTARPSDTRPGTWQESGAPTGSTFKWSDKGSDECIAPVRIADQSPPSGAAPSLQDATTSLLAQGRTLPSLQRQDYHTGKGYPGHEYSGYQVDWNHEDVHVSNPANPAQAEGISLNGYNLYGGLNAGHGAVPVYDMLFTKTGTSSYYHLPVYNATGPGFLYRCGGNDHAAQSGGFLAPVATDTWDFQQVKATPSASDPSGTHPGGWANIIPAVK